MSDRSQDRKKMPAGAAELRKRAEEKAGAVEPVSLSAQTPEAIEQLIHELRVHQIELELQTEELRTAQAEIEESRARYFDLYDLAPVGYVTVSEKGLIFEANLTAATLLGVSRSALVKKPLTRFIFREDQDIYYLHRKILFESGEPQSCELRLVRPDGSTFWAWLDATFMEGSDGEPVCRVVMSDMTERKEAEAALRKSEEKHRRLFETMILGVVYQAADGKIISANPAAERILGLTLDQMQGKTSMDPGWKAIREDGSVLPGEEHAAMVALRTGKKVGPSVMGVYHPQKQEHVWLSVNATPLFKPGETKPYQVYATFEDITDRMLAEAEIRKLNKELEQRVVDRTTQLEAVNKELTSFAYSISHDFRAPLRALDGFSASLQTKYDEHLDDQGRHYLNRIRNAAIYMSNLVDDLLNLSRITRSDFKQQQVDLSKLASELSTALQEVEPQRKAKIKVAPDLQVHGDAALLQAALQNLLENAWKFSSKEKQTEIEVGRTAVDGEAVFFVRDNGVGFNMAYADKLFIPFQRLHRADEFPGTGIGLATVQRIINRHGGRIWAEAEAGKGATFYFTLKN